MSSTHKSIVVEVDQAVAAVPHFWHVVGPSAEHMHSTVASVAVHRIIGVIDSATHQAWLFGFEKTLIIEDHTRIKVRLLLFLSYCI